MIRSLLIVILIVAFLILSIPILIVEWIIGKFNPYARDISSLRIVQFMFKLILFVAGTKVTVIGEDRIPKDTPVLYVGNHRSYFDVVLTYARCPGLTGYVAKDSMKKIPLLSSWMKRLHCLFLNRSDIKEGLKTILQGIDQMKNGVSMCIFPEGTRNEASDDTLLLPFKEGSLKMAEKTGYPIIPMYAFLESRDWSGKTIYPFCTCGSGIWRADLSEGSAKGTEKISRCPLSGDHSEHHIQKSVTGIKI